MWKDLFKFADLLELPLVVMFFFMLVFAIVVVRALSKRRKPHYEAMAQLPLLDEGGN